MGILTRISPAWMIIVILILLLFLQRECHHCPDVRNIVSKTDTCYIVGDSIPYPYPIITTVKVDSIIHDTTFRKVDTALILADYFAKVYGNQILADDSSVFVSVQYMVTQNRLAWMLPSIANRKPTAIIQNTTVINQPVLRTKFFAGIGVGRSPTEFGLTANALLLTKNDHAYSLSYDFLNHDVYCTLYWKIKFK